MAEKVIQELKEAAALLGLTIQERGSGHYHILGGPLLVNYYPLSPHRTVYIKGMRTCTNNVSPAQACQMAVTLPKFTGTANRKSAAYTRYKNKQWKKFNRKCHWCEKPLTRSQMTLDHVIPLARGGLNNANNWVIACEDCNGKRGDQMPEIKKPPVAGVKAKAAQGNVPKELSDLSPACESESSQPDPIIQGDFA